MAATEMVEDTWASGIRKPGLLLFLAGIAALSACSAPINNTVHVFDPATCANRLAEPYTEFSVTVATEDGRDIPFTVFAPSRAGTYPMAAFSHGAFASPTRYRALLGPLAGAGYIIIAPMHIDSEEFGSTERPSPLDTWNTRNEDMALALNPNVQLAAALADRTYFVDDTKVASLGHSYGAVIAQIAGGAVATGPDGAEARFLDQDVDAVIGWSPPGIVPGMMAAEGWSSLTAPTMTITGTTDILPGFIDQWQAHKATYDYSPVGARALWVGDGINHYFGGMFGREKPADENSQRLFQRALAVSLNYMDRKLGNYEICEIGPAVSGEIYQED